MSETYPGNKPSSRSPSPSSSSLVIQLRPLHLSDSC